MSSGPSFAYDAICSNGGSSRTHPTRSQRSSIMDAQDDDEDDYMPDYLLNLPSDEARTRFLSEIRQVLDALHRWQSRYVVLAAFLMMRWQAKHENSHDFFVFEPFVHDGLAELHDKHRDMRLDVDNMSYEEELFALGERIGDEYVNGDDIGILDCGHEFHSECITQWLAQKNLFPICKTTGLIT
ncbi:hypothetical protein MLD38_032111 [Melastoma candidum]|uniref:Uncharacterized protein n=1 Tax=Melastoma candidum TaxID=119954 RepID=A0ACB9M2L7_9MYRT|nr:hypothetical protein MLD38_032111 [Melastoma candidum]